MINEGPDQRTPSPFQRLSRERYLIRRLNHRHYVLHVESGGKPYKQRPGQLTEEVPVSLPPGGFRVSFESLNLEFVSSKDLFREEARKDVNPKAAGEHAPIIDGYIWHLKE